MLHYGDITKIDGHKVPLVDVVTGGSPCQDLSVAGKREGLAGARSGLYMEQIRVVKEMRDESFRQLSMRGADVDIRCIQPRYMVWENVPGAFSSNQGEDFRAVLEEAAQIIDKDATIPRPDKGKWTPAGLIIFDHGSIAWRVHDLQYHGCPQRRKRICMLCDFNGQSAGEILFELWRETEDTEPIKTVTDFRNESRPEVSTVFEGLSRDSEQGEQERQETSGDIGTSSSESDSAYTLKIRGGVDRDSNGKTAGKGALVQTEKSSTLGVSQDQTLIQCLNSWDVQSKHIQPQEGIAEALYSGECRGGGGESYVMQNTEVYGICSDNSNSMKSSNPYSGIYKAETTRTLDLNGGNPACNQGGMIVLEGNGQRESHKGDGYKESEIMYTLNTVEQHAVFSIDEKMGQTYIGDDVGNTLAQRDYKQPQAVVYSVDQGGGKSSCMIDAEKSPTLTTTHDGAPAVCYGLDRASFNQGKNAQYDFSVKEEVAQTLVAKGPGGGTSETVGSLCARDYKGVGSQYVDEGKCIVQRIE